MKIIRNILFFIIWWVCRAVAFFVYPRKLIHKERLLKKQKFVAVANHQHWVDLVYLYLKSPVRFWLLAKKELREKIWILRFLQKEAGISFVDRENPELSTIKEIMGVLKKNKPILVFPEGTRNASGNGELQPLKPGAAMFAIKAQAPMIPTIVLSPARAFRRNYVYVGEAFDVSEYYGVKMTEELTLEANEKMRNAMLKAQGELREYMESKRRKRDKKPKE